ncbi:MAG: CRISPR-associated endoribonuclease Cas6 [Spirosomaceae bacterium]|jgi:CRISPR-associated endoribonuclease Cas6|nr:CRISPR-associated endoribonuclease Cas6 [Spirosomataceae bacterium]
MKLQLTLRRTGPANLLPLNYQYPLSAWIYRTLEQADAQYSDFLHNRGYTTQRKSFKLFTFSGLEVADFQVRGDRMEVRSHTITLRVHFYLDQPAQTFVMGLFQARECRLWDQHSEARFVVAQVEALPSPPLAGTVHLHTLSPLVVARRNPRGHDDYLPPDDPDFAPLLRQNLLDKYEATGQLLRPEWANERLEVQPLPKPVPKSRLVTIKAGQPEETRIRGYLFDLVLTAPEPLLELAVLAGLGRYNAEGFGCCEPRPSGGSG